MISLFSDITGVKNVYAVREVEAQQKLPCRIARAVTDHLSTQVPLSVKLDAAELLMIQPCEKVVECHQTMVARGNKDVMPRQLFDVFVANLSENPEHLPKHVVVGYAGALSKCFIHARGD